MPVNIAPILRAEPVKSGLVVFWLASMPVLALLYLMLPTSPDQALFDYMAWMNLQGAPYYQGVAEQNWPGIMLIHELGIRLFGVHFWSFRLADFLIMQASTLGIFLFLWRSKFSLAPFVGLALYPVLYTTAGSWMAGQRDIIATGLLLMASALWLADARNRADMIQACIAGAIIGFAVLIKPTYLSFLFGLLLLDRIGFIQKEMSKAARNYRSLFVLAGFLAIVGFVLFVGWLIGSLDDWYEQTILFNLQAYPSGGSRLDLLPKFIGLLQNSWHWMAVFAGFGLMLWFYNQGVRREPVIMVGLGLTIILSYFVQNKGFGYHLGGLIPLFVVLIAVCIDQLLIMRASEASSDRRWAFGAVSLVVIAITTAGAMKKTTALLPQMRVLAESEFKPVHAGINPNHLSAEEVQELVDIIQAGSTADAYFLQWGRRQEIGYLAQRRSSTRFIFSPALDVLSLSGRFEKADAWLAEFKAALVDKPPVFVMIDRASLDSIAEPLPLPSEASAAMTALIGHLNQGYRLVLAGDKVVLFEKVAP